MAKPSEFITQGEKEQIEMIQNQIRFMKSVLDSMILSGKSLPPHVTQLFTEERHRLSKETAKIFAKAEFRKELLDSIRSKRKENPT